MFKFLKEIRELKAQVNLHAEELKGLANPKPSEEFTALKRMLKFKTEDKRFEIHGLRDLMAGLNPFFPPPSKLKPYKYSIELPDGTSISTLAEAKVTESRTESFETTIDRPKKTKRSK